MAEAVGLAASIIGLIEISTKLARLAKELYDSGKDARTSILRIKAEMENLHLIFCRVQVLVESRTQKKPRRIRLKMIPVHHLLTILTGCMLYYSDLDEKLSGLAQPTSVAGPARNIIARVKWSIWTEAEVAVILDNLERQKSSLLLMLTIINWYVVWFSHETL